MRGVNIFKVARECGVKLMEAREATGGKYKPFHCYCKSTVRAIGAEHGEEHLRLVLMLMTGTRENASALQSDLMKAVSRVLVGYPELTRRPALVDEFNAMDLCALRDRAQDLRKCGVPLSEVETVMLALHLQADGQPQQITLAAAA